MPSDSFEENTGFQLPGLGSAEKDTPGSFRAGTPFNKVSGDPETEVSQELTDIKEAQKEVKKSNVAASMAQALANKNKADLNKHLENADAPKMGATMEFEEKPLTEEAFRAMPLKERLQHLRSAGYGAPESGWPEMPRVDNALLGMIKGIKKYGPSVLETAVGGGGQHILNIGKKIRDRIKGE